MKSIDDVDLLMMLLPQEIRREQVRIAVKSKYVHGFLMLEYFESYDTVEKEEISHHADVGRMPFDLW
jgi:hypothetical protein